MCGDAAQGGVRGQFCEIMQRFSNKNEDLYLVYSKKSTDNLPITATRVESQPCAFPDQLFEPAEDLYYPLERDRKKEACQVHQGTGKATDDRYKDTGGWVTEYEVQKASGVLATMREMPLYT